MYKLGTSKDYHFFMNSVYTNSNRSDVYFHLFIGTTCNWELPFSYWISNAREMAPLSRENCFMQSISAV